MGYCRGIGLEAQAASWLLAAALRLLRALIAPRRFRLTAGSGKTLRQAPSTLDGSHTCVLQRAKREDVGVAVGAQELQAKPVKLLLWQTIL